MSGLLHGTGSRLALGVALALGALGALAWGGAQLSEAGLGRSLATRGCDTALAPGLALLVVAGVLWRSSRAVLELASLGEHGVLVVDWWRAMVALPVPVVAAIAAMPGMLGCEGAARLEEWGAVGRALLGTPGIAVGGAALMACGVALGAALTAASTAGLGPEEPVDPTQRFLDRAMEQADAADAPGFRGVDDLDEDDGGHEHEPPGSSGRP